jgi:hypothetical protein
MVDPEVIHTTSTTSAGPAARRRRPVDLANQNGGRDNTR